MLSWTHCLPLQGFEGARQEAEQGGSTPQHRSPVRPEAPPPKSDRSDSSKDFAPEGWQPGKQ